MITALSDVILTTPYGSTYRVDLDFSSASSSFSSSTNIPTGQTTTGSNQISSESGSTLDGLDESASFLSSGEEQFRFNFATATSFTYASTLNSSSFEQIVGAGGATRFSTFFSSLYGSFSTSRTDGFTNTIVNTASTYTESSESFAPDTHTLYSPVSYTEARSTTLSVTTSFSATATHPTVVDSSLSTYTETYTGVTLTTSGSTYSAVTFSLSSTTSVNNTGFVWDNTVVFDDGVSDLWFFSTTGSGALGGKAQKITAETTLFASALINSRTYNIESYLNTFPLPTSGSTGATISISENTTETVPATVDPARQQSIESYTGSENTDAEFTNYSVSVSTIPTVYVDGGSYITEAFTTWGLTRASSSETILSSYTENRRNSDDLTERTTTIDRFYTTTFDRSFTSYPEGATGVDSTDTARIIFGTITTNSLQQLWGKTYRGELKGFVPRGVSGFVEFGTAGQQSTVYRDVSPVLPTQFESMTFFFNSDVTGLAVPPGLSCFKTHGETFTMATSSDSSQNATARWVSSTTTGATSAPVTTTVPLTGSVMSMMVSAPSGGSTLTGLIELVLSQNELLSDLTGFDTVEFVSTRGGHLSVVDGAEHDLISFGNGVFGVTRQTGGGSVTQITSVSSGTTSRATETIVALTALVAATVDDDLTYTSIDDTTFYPAVYTGLNSTRWYQNSVSTF